MDNLLLEKIINKYSNKILPPFDSIVDMLGVDKVIYLSEEFGGGAIYIPTKKRLFGDCIAEQIKCEFNGCNYRELAVKYSLCERTIRNITSNNRKYHW